MKLSTIFSYERVTSLPFSTSHQLSNLRYWGGGFNKHIQYEPPRYMKSSKKFHNFPATHIDFKSFSQSMQGERGRILSFNQNNKVLYLLNKQAASVPLIRLMYYILLMFNPINQLPNVLSLAETNCANLVTKSKLFFCCY